MLLFLGRVTETSVKVHRGLGRLLQAITGWGCVKNSFILLAASVLCDFFAERLKPNGITAGWMFAVGIWILVIYWVSIDISDYLKQQDPDAISLKLVHWFFWAGFIILMSPVDTYFELRKMTSVPTLGSILVLWEGWLDIATVSVLWQLTPPGKSIFARAADKLAERGLTPARSQN